MNSPHHHHHHPGVAIGHLPFGMVTSNGIGIPIMTAPISVPSLPAPPQSKKMVSPDSSDDGKEGKSLILQPHHHRTPSPNSPHSTNNTVNGGNHSAPPPSLPPWSNQLLSNIGSLGYPVMGMGMGMMHPVLPDSNMLYGIISATTTSEFNQMSQNPNTTTSQVNLPPGPPVLPVPMPVPGIINPNTPSQSQPVLPLVTSQPQPNQSNNNPQPIKEIIHCPSCTLFPPNTSAPLPTTREKPPGCRTVFIGGLPENITDDMMREIFERCGEITTIRMSKKNFAHIRFELEGFVENAIYFSGFRVRIGSNSDAANIGRLHVDYAQARDDLYEWECRERKLERERRHRDRIEQERLLPTSPPPVPHYSEHEAITVAEKLKVDETFIKAVQTLIIWLDRGDCTKKNANGFYSMIQSTNSHVRRLLAEKGQYDEELQKAKELIRQRMNGLLMQFGQIEKVFIAACHKKSWDHFTKAQRKNIDIWKKQAGEIKNVQLEEALNERTDEEMELSDIESETDGSSAAKRMRVDDHEDKDKTVNQLKEENDSLRCQLEAFKNEVDLIKADLRTDLEAKDHQIRELQKQLLALSCKNHIHSTDETWSSRESPPTCFKGATSSSSSSSSITSSPSSSSSTITVNSLENCDSSSNNSISSLQLNSSSSSSNTNNNNVRSNNNNSDSQSQVFSNCDSWSTSDINITETEVRLISIISTFLNVHPFGAQVDYIWSYAQKVLPCVRPHDLETLLHKFPTLFREYISGVGATLERKWKFIGFC